MPNLNGKGPRRGSRMHAMGRRGPRAGFKQGNC